MGFDLLVRNARTRSSAKDPVDIAIRAGRSVEIRAGLEGEACLAGDARQTIDAGGKLVTESFVNGHLHLCKVYTLKMAGENALSSHASGTIGGSMTAIERAARAKEHYDERWIIDNVRQAIRLAIRFGKTHIRAFADTDTKGRVGGSQGPSKSARGVPGAGRDPGGGVPAGWRGARPWRRGLFPGGNGVGRRRRRRHPLD